MIRAGIIGWGENGQKIAEALHFHIKGTEVVAIATSDADAREYASRKMGLKHVFSSYEPLLELHQIDIIIICSVGDRHAEHVKKSLISGSNIFIDHPLSSNVQDCQTIEKIIDHYPSYKCTVAFPRRKDPSLLKIKKELQQNKLGKILRVDCQTYEQYRKVAPDKSDQNKGIFMDLMLQDIDIARWITGSEYESVYVIGNSHKYPSLGRQNDADTAVAIAQMSEGIIAQFSSSRVIHQGPGFSIKIVGTLGEINYSTITKSDNIVSSQEGKPYYWEDISSGNEYIPLLQDFVSVVKFGGKLTYDLPDATEATRVAVAMTKSFLLGQEILLK